MKLMKGAKWASEYFDKGSKPDNRTVHGWIENKVIPGTILNGTAYVFKNKWEAMLVSDDNDIADAIAKILNDSEAA